MNLTTKLILAAAALCTFTAVTPARADWDDHRHYYAGRHYWHGRWYGPGFYGPRIFVGSPFYWGGFGPRVSVRVGGPFYRHGYYHRRWWGGRWHRW